MKRLYLRSSVAAGHPSRKGDGFEKRLLQVAEGGDAGAPCNLGILYGSGLDDNGHAVEANRLQAVRWLLARRPSRAYRLPRPSSRRPTPRGPTFRAPADRVRVVSASGDALARHPSEQRSIRIRASSLALDPGANRRGKVLRARLDGDAAETSC